MRRTTVGEFVLRDAWRSVAPSKIVGVPVDPAGVVARARVGVPVDGDTLVVGDARCLALGQRRQR